MSAILQELSLEFFLERIESGASVLDVGAGDGAVSIPLARKGCHVTAIDQRTHRIEKIRAQEGCVTALTGDFFTYPFEPESFDYVISRKFVPHFMDQWPMVLARKAALCRKGILFHAHSSECAELADKISTSKKTRGAVGRAYRTRGAMSLAELEQFCAGQNLRIAALRPVSFLLPKGVLWRSGLSAEQRHEFHNEFDEWLQNDDVRAFALWLERSVMANMPRCLSTSFMAALERSPT